MSVRLQAAMFLMGCDKEKGEVCKRIIGEIAAMTRKSEPRYSHIIWDLIGQSTHLGIFYHHGADNILSLKPDLRFVHQPAFN